MDLESLAPEASSRSDDAAHERELRETVDAALAQLPPDQALAFTWAILEQRSYSEIEAHTGWSRSKVKISVFRARRRVMEELEAAGLGPGGDRKEAQS
jgi:RNA polymerase sigma factor (sigma-70 family)